MNAEEIDRLFEAIMDEDYETIWKLADMKEVFDEDILDEKLDEIYRKIAKKIEQGDWKHFITKKNTDSIVFWCNILAHTDNVEEMKKSIEDREELGLCPNSITKLIVGTRDEEYIKQCIEDREKLRLYSHNIAKLIVETRDKEYIKQCIEDREKLGLNSFDITELIVGTRDEEYIKQCIEDREKLGLDSRAITKLIVGTRDEEYIKQCIEDRKKLRLGFSITELIVGTRDEEYIKQCIEDREKLGLDSRAITKLIVGTRDEEYIKQCIEDREKLGLKFFNITDLIIGTRDEEYIKQCIEDREKLGQDSDDITKLIVVTRDKEYIKQCIEDREKLGLNFFNIKDLIVKTGDDEYINQCIEDREELGLDYYKIIQLTRSLKDEKYIKQCIENREKLGLNSEDITALIVRIKDEEYIKQCIDDREKLRLDSDNIRDIIFLTRYKEYIKQCIENIDKPGLDIKAKISLPESMTIGIEVESIGCSKDATGILINYILGNWRCKGDCSLKADKRGEDGIEIVSPILEGSNKNVTSEIRKVGVILSELGNYTNDSCGGHIHIGANYLKSVQAWQNLVELWGNTEEILYIIGNEKGEITRSGVPEYAAPISGELENALNNDTINLSDEKDLESFKQKLVDFQTTRYKGVNFQNLAYGGKGTIEFRLPNGTINPDTWIENINLFGGIVGTAQKLSEVQEKNDSELTEEEKNLLANFELLKSDNLDEREKLELLLQIVIPKQSRDTYRARYETNSKLLKEHPYMDSAIREQTSKKGISITKEKIGESIFSGQDHITASEEQIVEQVFGRKVEEQQKTNEEGELKC